MRSISLKKVRVLYGTEWELQSEHKHLCPASKNCAPLQSQCTYRCGFKNTNMDSMVESVVSRRTRQSYLQESGVLFCTYVCKRLISMVFLCARTQKIPRHEMQNLSDTLSKRSRETTISYVEDKAINPSSSVYYTHENLYIDTLPQRPTQTITS